jgi:hypothetical protein
MKQSVLHRLLSTLMLVSGFSQAMPVEEPLKDLRAPDKTRWTVAIQSTIPPKAATPLEKDGDASKRPLPVLVQSTGAKEGQLYRVTNLYDNQSIQDFWITPHMQFLKSSGRDQIVRLLPSQNRAWNLEECDFPELYWAIGRTPEAREIDARKLLVIRIEAAEKPFTKRQQRDFQELRQAMNQAGDPMPEPLEPVPGILVLYLDPATRLPIRFEDGDRVHHYSFEKSADLKKTIPEEIMKEISSWEKTFAESSRTPSKPKIRNPKSQ